jgi:hypothetical protein
MNHPPLTTASLVPYSALNSFSEVVPAEKMAELERKYRGIMKVIGSDPIVNMRVIAILEEDMEDRG